MCTSAIPSSDKALLRKGRCVMKKLIAAVALATVVAAPALAQRPAAKTHSGNTVGAFSARSQVAPRARAHHAIGHVDVPHFGRVLRRKGGKQRLELRNVGDVGAAQAKPFGD